jgi:hypothetical protein
MPFIQRHFFDYDRTTKVVQNLFSRPRRNYWKPAKRGIQCLGIDSNFQGRKAMKGNFAKTVTFMIACLLLSTHSFAQNERKDPLPNSLYIISAKAGGINFISGDVAVARSASGKREFLKSRNPVESRVLCSAF